MWDLFIIFINYNRYYNANCNLIILFTYAFLFCKFLKLSLL